MCTSIAAPGGLWIRYKRLSKAKNAHFGLWMVEFVSLQKFESFAVSFDISRFPRRPRFDVHVISQRDHFVFTPLLPKVCSGMVRPNTCTEPIVNFLPNKANFYHGRCISVDTSSRHVTLEPCTSRREPLKVPFDILILAVGAESNSFGIPGVHDNAFFLKEVEHAYALYKHLSASICDANLVLARGGSAADLYAELTKLLHVIVVGGGPTGVEVAGEVNWLFFKHLKHSFPHLVPYARVTIVEGGNRLLPSFGVRNSAYVLKKFSSLGINVKLETCVVEVHKDGVSVKDKHGKVNRLYANSVVWASGLKRTDFAAKFCEALKDTQSNPRGILVDANFKVLGAENIYALGDCAKIVPPSLVDNVDEVCKVVGYGSGTAAGGGGEAGDFVEALLKKHKLLSSKYPQLHPSKVNWRSREVVKHLRDLGGSGGSLDSLKGSGQPSTGTGVSRVSLENSRESGGAPYGAGALKTGVASDGSTTTAAAAAAATAAVLQWLDQNYLPPFPTAQVAKQQSIHLAKHLNSKGKRSNAFLEVWNGSLASIGGKYVVGHFSWGQLNGATLARAIWYAVYITMFSSWRMRIEFLVDAITQAIFKRKLTSK